MNLFSKFENQIKKIVEAIEFNMNLELDLSKISVEPPRDSCHGDLATNAAMVLAKQVGINPRELAASIGGELEHLEDIKSTQIAGPGFINIKLEPAFWARHLGVILSSGSQYGGGLVGQGKKVNIEYVSANPTGPMHVGHCRGAVIGDTLSNLLAFAGFDVTREYYVNDAGAQVDVLASSLFLRYREALGEDIGQIPEGLYPGDYLLEPAKRLAEQHQDQLLSMDDTKRMALLRSFAIDQMMDLIREDLGSLNIHHDVFFSERELHDKVGGRSEIESMLSEMRERGFVYDGHLPPPKGEVPEDWENREQTLFKSTQVGDDIDRPLVKSDGSFTYFAADIAYFKNKFDRGFERMVYVLGADHGGYVKRLKAVAQAVSGGAAELDVLMVQLVKLLRDNKPVQMSKRSGNFVTLRDVVDEVGCDAVRFMMLFRKAEALLDFDFQKVTEQTRDNPVFYVQYAHARACSVFRQVTSEMPDLSIGEEELAKANLLLLNDEGELDLIRKLAEFPRIIEQAANADEPHRLAFYLNDLASEFHTHWNRGKEKPKLRFINHKYAQLTLARLAMLHAMALVLASGLSIIGASAPQEMR
ncbi:MAG: arginine--tRNA ligase [Hyphomicrobiales bacterium]|nr:arginine--tRNA ligase [Hyphomicrobiales bacterium]